MAITNEEFRAALGRFASGVSVVTGKTADEQLFGITVSAFTSVSLNPPLILICIDKRSTTHDHFAEGNHFAVNILGEDQELQSRRFASREADKFAGIGYAAGVTGAPLLDGALACLECRIVHAYEGGDHTIIVGEIEATRLHESKPLLYFRGGYAQLK
jgi:3-hydroxy-9,10-secoandrosta-1,3,5(10)-triene-9,17-dione monooxygenase reductase component